MFSSESWLSNQQAGFYNGVATQSLRFNRADSPELSYTPSASNRKTYVISTWLKLGSNFDQFRTIFGTGGGTSRDRLQVFNNSKLVFNINDGTDGSLTTNAVLRDCSAWYHIVAMFDTRQVTDTNRMKLYVNGQEKSYSATTYPSQDYEGRINQNAEHFIGNSSADNFYLDGYLAEFNFIDGLSFFSDTSGTPNPSFNINSFGELKNGVWIPIEYTGSYGTNGYRLEFKQTGTGTASSSTIGADTSGNDNHLSSGGITASDCDMPDSPENNFATFNGVDTRFRSELAEGNLNLRATTYSSGNFGHSICTFPIPSSGKWYIEAYGLNITGNNTTSIGIMDRNVVSTSATQVNYSITTDEGFDGIRQGHYSSPFMRIVVDGTQSGSDISFTNQSAISALAIDVDNGYIYVGGNDGTGGTGSEITWRDYADGSTGSSNVDPTSGSSGTGGIARTFTNNDIIVCDVSVSGDNSSKSQVYLNAGQDSSFAGNLTAQGNSDANGIGDFYYQVPDGYLALCASNLPEPTISPNEDTQADDYFNTVTYIGTGSTQSITGVGFQPDWVWIKRRNGVAGQILQDSSRGSTLRLRADNTDPEITTSTAVTSFDTNGFTLGTEGGVNTNTGTYVAWNWKANGGTTSSNTDGSITSTVQANTDAGFSIVSFTGNGSNDATIGHGLGTTPAMIITKNRDDSVSWRAWHQDLTSTYVLLLNSTVAETAPAGQSNGYIKTVGSSTYSVYQGNVDTNGVNGSGDAMIAYCFAEIEGYSKFGSYIGNGSTDGPFVYTGFRPAWVMMKNTTTSGNSWVIQDKARSTYNEVNAYLLANDSGAEGTGVPLDFLSNGFKMTSASQNDSGANFIYMAFAENPFKYANAR